MNMPYSDDLEKITDNPDIFIKECIEKNIELAFEKNIINPTMYDFLGGLAEFGSYFNSHQGAFPERRYSIFSTSYYSSSMGNQAKIFYLTDDLGLINSYVIGPDLAKERDNSYKYFSRRLFYGFKLGFNEINTKTYGCIQDFEKGKEISVPIVDVNKLRAEFLPLPKDEWNKVNKYYLAAYGNSLGKGKESNNSLIHQNEKRTYFLPFDELVLPEIGEGGIVSTSGKLKADFLEIRVTKKTHMRKQEMTETWEGKVSYERFDLLELSLIDTEYYNTW